MKRIKLLAAYIAVSLNSVSAAQITDDFAAANELAKQQKYAEAEQSFQQLLSQQPNQLSLLNNLAVMQMSQGKVDQALQTLQSAIESDKVFAVSQKNLSKIYAYMASQAYARALSQEASEPVPGLPQLQLIDAPAAVIEQQPVIVEPVENTQDSSVAETQSVTDNTQSNDAEQLEKQLSEKLHAWSQAWMQGDIDTYLASYAAGFNPPDGLNLDEWKNQRRYRLRHSKQVSVSYNQLKFYISDTGHTVIAEFIQDYSAGNYKDRVNKQLYWAKDGQDWFIIKEQVTEKF